MARFPIRKFIRYFPGVIVFTCLLMACACAAPGVPAPTPTPREEPLPTQPLPAVPGTPQPTVFAKTVDEFKASLLDYMPGATVVDWALSDIDGDGQEDYVAIFNHAEPGWPETSSSVGVVCADGARVAVNVASDKPGDFVFTLDPRFFVEDSTAHFQLQSLTQLQNYQYKVKFERLEMGFNVVVSSEKFA